MRATVAVIITLINDLGTWKRIALFLSIPEDLLNAMKFLLLGFLFGGPRSYRTDILNS